MFSRQSRMMGAIYGVIDGVLALASFWLAYDIRQHWASLRPLYPVSYYPWIVPLLLALWLVVGWASGIYRDVLEERLRRVLADPLKVAVVSTILLFAFIFAFNFAYISRMLLGFYAVIDLALMILLRLAGLRWGGRLATSVSGYRRFLLIGGSAEAVEIAKAIESNEGRGMRLAGFVLATRDTQGEMWVDQSGFRHGYPVFELDELPELLHRHVIDEVIFAVSREDLATLEHTFLLCEQEGVKARLALGFFPHLTSSVSLEHLREIPLLTFSTTPENEYLMLWKRMADFVMAGILVIVFSPLFLLLAVLIKITSRGSVFYRQVRCGLGGRRFVLFKFRSMRVGADLDREALEALNEMDGPVFKIKNDPRCTTAGRFMRKLSLDEFPQLFNILRGDMSFVGPRPPLPQEVDRYERWQRRRLRMRPGLTCLWALKGRNRLNFKQWMELDLEYIDRWSPLLDWKILVKTIPVVLLGRGAF
ncbi:MAG: sugar transferase [Terriglobia bacterium]